MWFVQFWAVLLHVAKSFASKAADFVFVEGLPDTLGHFMVGLLSNFPNGLLGLKCPLFVRNFPRQSVEKDLPSDWLKCQPRAKFLLSLPPLNLFLGLVIKCLNGFPVLPVALSKKEKKQKKTTLFGQKKRFQEKSTFSMPYKEFTYLYYTKFPLVLCLNQC